jgi:hypothetical protein
VPLYKLTKISKNPNDLRTNEVIGELSFVPKIGTIIEMKAKALVAGDYRLVTTSVIQRIERSLYYTQNSIYKLDKYENEN